jgi:hypothetical protein
MLIYISTNDHEETAGFTVYAVPRIGEAVELMGHYMRVTDVVHELAGRGTRIVVHVR